jgi:hypothetical protein
MRTISEQELKNILDRHGRYLRNEEGGERANLSYTDLGSANLSYANLSSTDLSYTDLSFANLRFADLRSADLSFANLRFADLRSADLRSADLSFAREDFFKVLSEARSEVLGLYDALLRGKINGTQYSGTCACLMGTIANVRKVYVKTLACDASRESERWFLAIREGDVPRSNPVSKITKQWIEEFCHENKIVLPQYKLVSSDKHPNVFESK